MTLHFMSDKELSRLEILRDLGSGCLTTSAAADLLGLERRQVQRLVKAYQEQGATALISKKRGRPSNRQALIGLKEQVLEVIRAKYTDFGPTLPAETLREVHGITIGRETLRLWMLDAGLWADRVKRRNRVYQPRYRRECVGELAESDGLADETSPQDLRGQWSKGEQSAVDGHARRMSAGDQGGVTVRGGEGSERVETDGVVGCHIQRDLGEGDRPAPTSQDLPNMFVPLGPFRSVGRHPEAER